MWLLHDGDIQKVRVFSCKPKVQGVYFKYKVKMPRHHDDKSFFSQVPKLTMIYIIESINNFQGIVYYILEKKKKDFFQQNLLLRTRVFLRVGKNDMIFYNNLFIFYYLFILHCNFCLTNHCKNFTLY